MIHATFTGNAFTEFEQLPEGTRAEFIQGRIVMEPAPMYVHQDLAGNLYYKIRLVLDSLNSKSVIVIAPIDVYLNSEIIVQPDLSFIKEENLSIIKEQIYGVPDMLIEILSPSSMSHDLITKYKIYEASGVKEYFVINPGDKLVICYRLSDMFYMEIYRECGIIKSEVMNTTINF